MAACAWQYAATRGPTNFERVCAAMEAEYPDACKDLDAPVVIISSAPLAIGSYGFYIHDEKYVYVLPQEKMDMLSKANYVKRWPTTEQVVFHETIHYILSNISEEKPARCESEALARRLTAAEFNYKESTSWRARYRCGLPTP